MAIRPTDGTEVIALYFNMMNPKAMVTHGQHLSCINCLNANHPEKVMIVPAKLPLMIPPTLLAGPPLPLPSSAPGYERGIEEDRDHSGKVRAKTKGKR